MLAAYRCLLVARRPSPPPCPFPLPLYGPGQYLKVQIPEFGVSPRPRTVASVTVNTLKHLTQLLLKETNLPAQHSYWGQR